MRGITEKIRVRSGKLKECKWLGQVYYRNKLTFLFHRRKRVNPSIYITCVSVKEVENGLRTVLYIRTTGFTTKAGHRLKKIGSLIQKVQINGSSNRAATPDLLSSNT